LRCVSGEVSDGGSPAFQGLLDVLESLGPVPEA